VRHFFRSLERFSTGGRAREGSGLAFLVLLLGSIIAITRSREVSGTEIAKQVSDEPRLPANSTQRDMVLRSGMRFFSTTLISNALQMLWPIRAKYLDQFAEAFMAVNNKNYPTNHSDYP
jgi:hypothetical protein